jgi:hypothetical protein
MSENGIMQDIRELLYKGQNVPEIIAQGYAPSTVYRVQRDTRLKSGVFRNSSYRKKSTSCRLEYWGPLEAENLRLNQRLDALESQLAVVGEDSDVGSLWDGLEDLQQALDKIATRQEQITRQIQAHNAIIGQIDTELDTLAQVFKKDVWLGEPKWQRQTTKK